MLAEYGIDRTLTELAFHRSRIESFAAHEIALMALGLVTALALILLSRASNVVLLEVGGATILYATVIFACHSRPDRFGPKIRFLISYAFVLWYYCAIARITPALGTKLRDRNLLAIDEAICGQTPAVLSQQVAASWVTNLLSLCYLSYHLYLILVVIWATRVSNLDTDRLGAHLFLGFAVGFVGYLVIPALGPGLAYPELFSKPLVGGPMSRLIASVVDKGSSRYDVFPSLHIMITCIMLDHDWRQVRQRFWVMVGPSMGLLVSTVYLRYHYGVDVLAGFLLFLAVRHYCLRAWNKKVRLPQ
jgi:hypothetical protein